MRWSSVPRGTAQRAERPPGAFPSGNGTAIVRWSSSHAGIAREKAELACAGRREIASPSFDEVPSLDPAANR